MKPNKDETNKIVKENKTYKPKTNDNVKALNKRIDLISERLDLTAERTDILSEGMDYVSLILERIKNRMGIE
tara:strand:+ start:313 stop:528 length:216 start_codon:yes stop_codon:yes gene_type:complete